MMLAFANQEMVKVLIRSQLLLHAADDFQTESEFLNRIHRQDPFIFVVNNPCHLLTIPSAVNRQDKASTRTSTQYETLLFAVPLGRHRLCPSLSSGWSCKVAPFDD